MKLTEITYEGDIFGFPVWINIDWDEWEDLYVFDIDLFLSGECRLTYEGHFADNSLVKIPFGDKNFHKEWMKVVQRIKKEIAERDAGRMFEQLSKTWEKEDRTLNMEVK